MADPIQKIDRLGSSEEPRTSGLMSTKILDFFNTSTLAGQRVPTKSEDTFEKMKRLVTESKDSAKGIKMNVEHKLPWEYDIQGKLYSTEMEQKRFKLNHLRDKINKYKNQNKATTAYKLQALYNTFYPLKTEITLLEAEANFKRNLFCWILGEGSTAEYEKCNWVRQVYDEKTKTNWTLADIDNYLGAGGIGLFKSEEDINRVKKLRLQLTQTMLRAYPQLSQGMIEKADNLQFKAKAFIDYLKRTPPKTDEEAYLFYKYIVCGHKLDFNYICDPEYTKLLLQPTQPKQPIPQPIKKEDELSADDIDRLQKRLNKLKDTINRADVDEEVPPLEELNDEDIEEAEEEIEEEDAENILNILPELPDIPKPDRSPPQIPVIPPPVLPPPPQPVPAPQPAPGPKPPAKKSGIPVTPIKTHKSLIKGPAPVKVSKIPIPNTEQGLQKMYKNLLQFLVTNADIKNMYLTKDVAKKLDGVFRGQYQYWDDVFPPEFIALLKQHKIIDVPGISKVAYSPKKG
jgi:hypothetical protein